MSAIQITSASDLVDELAGAADWLEKLGVRIGQGRLSTYAKIASEWDSFVGEKSDLDVDYLYPRVSILAYEVPAFLKIIRAFHDVPIDDLGQIAKMLQKAVHGVVSVDEELLSRPNPARDYLFEALTAAHVHNPENGCTAIFNSPSDTGFILNRHHVFIECKRLNTDAGLQANVRKAANQLEKSFQRSPRTGNRGLIALDVSKIIRPPGQVFGIPESRLVDAASTELITRLVNIYFDELQRHLSQFDHRVIGFMVFCNFVVLVKSDQIFVNVGKWSIVPRSGIDAGDSRFIASLPSIMVPES
jgi:hypothetical protein